MSANSYLLMAAGCFLFLILLFVCTRIAANKSGENYVRNNEMREAIYSKHPGDAKIQGIISQPDFYRQLDWNLGRLHKSGAKILLTNSYQGRTFVITNHLFFTQSSNQESFPPLIIKKCGKNLGHTLKATLMIDKAIYQKQRSVVGSAVAGGIVAGGTGAIVGAISASNTNANGGKVVAHYSSAGYGLDFAHGWIVQCYISEDIASKFKIPVTGIAKHGYRCIETYGIDKQSVQSLVDYLNTVFISLYQEAQ